MTQCSTDSAYQDPPAVDAVLDPPQRSLIGFAEVIGECKATGTRLIGLRLRGLAAPDLVKIPKCIGILLLELPPAIEIQAV